MTTVNSRIRKLYYSDNLPVLKKMDTESIDLIYLDPPFNSNKAYNIIYPPHKKDSEDSKHLGQVKAFDDTWTWTKECHEYLKEIKKTSGGG